MQPAELTLVPGEPIITEWVAISPADLAARVVGSEADGGRPVIVAVDGRSGGGKSTLAARLVAAHPGAVLVGVDDFAWNAPMFGWAGLVRDGLLVPLAAGRDVRYRPPAWDVHGREGAIEVAANATLVVLEGVGSAATELADLLDAVIWVQSDFGEAERRGIARDIAQGVNGDAADATAFWHAWMADELAFQNVQRPWERADVIVAGTRAGVADPFDGPLHAANGPAPVR